MKRPASRLEDLKVGQTYRCCNYDIAFGEEWLTPVSIDLENRSMTYENAARHKKSVKFKEKSNESGWFSFNNIHSA